MEATDTPSSRNEGRFLSAFDLSSRTFLPYQGYAKYLIQVNLRLDYPVYLWLGVGHGREENLLIDMRVARSVATLAVFLLARSSSNGQAPLTRDRVSLARPILLQAETSSRATDPAARAFLLYRTAGAWLDVDLAHAVEVYRKAFAAARLIDSRPVKDAIEHDILSDLLPLSPAAALELIPQADAKTQEKMYTAAVHFLLLEHNVQGAVKAFEQASAADIFSERAATHLLAVANPADRDRIFRSAMAAFGVRGTAGGRGVSAAFSRRFTAIRYNLFPSEQHGPWHGSSHPSGKEFVCNGRGRSLGRAQPARYGA